MNLVTGIRRLLGYLVSTGSLGMGFLWMLIDDRRQGWHDKIAGTCVVYSWEARQNEEFLDRVMGKLKIREIGTQKMLPEGDLNVLNSPDDEEGGDPALLGPEEHGG